MTSTEAAKFAAYIANKTIAPGETIFYGQSSMYRSKEHPTSYHIFRNGCKTQNIHMYIKDIGLGHFATLNSKGAVADVWAPELEYINGVARMLDNQ